MTYKDLLEELRTVSEEQLKQKVVIHLMSNDNNDEYYPIQSVCVAVESNCDALEEVHLVLASRSK